MSLQGNIIHREYLHCSDIVISQCHCKMSLQGNIFIHREFFPCSDIVVFMMSLQNVTTRKCYHI